LERDQFESLVNQHKDSVYRQMIRVCGHREDAEDALASALMFAFKASETLKADAAFRNWLGTIGTRVCTRMRSHAGMNLALEYAEQHDLLATEEKEFDMAILKGCVQDAVEHLPETYRSVYTLCELEENTVPETAIELGISTAAVKSRLLRSREMIRKSLDHSVCAP